MCIGYPSEVNCEDTLEISFDRILALSHVPKLEVEMTRIITIVLVVALLLLLVPAAASAHPGHTGGRPHYHSGQLYSGEHHVIVPVVPVPYSWEHRYSSFHYYAAPRPVSVYVSPYGGAVRVHTRVGSVHVRW